jgi:hypothetical protein
MLVRPLSLYSVAMARNVVEKEAVLIAVAILRDDGREI